MAEEIKITPAALEDLPAIKMLLREADLPVEGVKERLEAGYVVARHEEEIVGLCGVERYGPDGLLRSAAVSSVWRGRGVGRALVNDRVSWAGQVGLRALYLLTTDAAGYFERLGFSRVDREETPRGIQGSSEFSSICPDTAIVMVLSLGDQGEDS